MAYIKEYWTDKDKRAEQARKHTKDMAEKYSRCIGTSIFATKIYDVDYFENIEFAVANNEFGILPVFINTIIDGRFTLATKG